MNSFLQPLWHLSPASSPHSYNHDGKDNVIIKRTLTLQDKGTKHDDIDEDADDDKDEDDNDDGEEKKKKRTKSVTGTQFTARSEFTVNGKKMKEPDVSFCVRYGRES